MLSNELIIYVVSLILRITVTDSDSMTETSSSFSDSDSYSDSSSLLKVQEYIDNSATLCDSQRKPGEIITFLTSLEESISETTLSRVDRLYGELSEVESAEKERVKSQINDLKKTVIEKAAQAKCPVPDDPSLMGEFDVMIDLVFEMCFANFMEKVDLIRDSAADRMVKLINRLHSAIESIQKGTANASLVCFQIVEETKVDLEAVLQIEGNYVNQSKSVFSLCSNMAYEQVQKFTPSVIHIATSCRT